MNSFVIEIWDDERRHCNFYTVRWIDSTQNETDKFFSTYDGDTKYNDANRELLIFVLKVIGEDHGALDIFFNRHENEVKGLPAQGQLDIQEFRYHYPDFPLRLYALKIRENIVILFNGGIKDGPTNQTSSLNFNWLEACRFARKIEKSIFEEEIIINEEEGKLYWYDGGEEIIL